MNQLTINLFINNLQQNKPFSYARYGDGEWLPILNKAIGQRNADGTIMSHQLGYELRKVVNNNYDYWHGLLPVARRVGEGDILAYLRSNGLSESNWYVGNPLLKTTLSGQFKPVLEQIRKHRVLYIGPDYLKQLNKEFFQYETYITVLSSNSWQQRRYVLPLIEAVIDRVDFIGYSAGMLSNLLIDDVFIKYPHVTQIDFGSIWDGYFNVRNRSYQSKVDWNELKRLNV